MEPIQLVLGDAELEQYEELCIVDGCALSNDAHPEDQFIADFVGWCAARAKPHDAWPQLARVLAQAVLDEGGPDTDVASSDLHALLARAVTLSVLARCSTRQRALLVRELRAFLRARGQSAAAVILPRSMRQLAA